MNTPFTPHARKCHILSDTAMLFAPSGWPSQCRPRPFYRGAQTRPCCLHPPGGPPSANQDLSTAEPRHGHAVCTLRVALPVPTKTFLPRSPDTAMLFAPSGCTHPPPLVPPFLLSQNLSPEDIAGSHMMKLKVL